MRATIDYAERVEEIAATLQAEFGVTDTQAVEVLLAARIECGLPYPWVVLETECYRLDMQGTWFSRLFENPISLPIYRTMRPRRSNAVVQEVLGNRQSPQLFVEPNWEMPVKIVYQFRTWDYLMQECVRLKTRYPKVNPPDERAGLLLSAAVQRAMDPRWKNVAAEMPKPPASLPYWCELLQRLSPMVRDWDSLLTNLCALAGRRAYLFNRRVDSTDWETVGRVMRDSIPAWTQEMVGHFGARGKVRSLRGKYSRAVIEGDIKRLAGEGLLFNDRGEWRVRDQRGRGADVAELISGVKIT